MTEPLTGTERIERELALLDTDVDPPAGWEARVLSAIGGERIERELVQLSTDAEPPAGWEARVLAATGGAREREVPQSSAEVDPLGDRKVRVAAATGDERIERELRPPGRVREGARTDERPTRRWWQVAIPVFALAVGALILFRPRSHPLDLQIGFSRAGAVTLAPAAADSANVDDVAHATATGGGTHRALWIYHGSMLVIACPGEARCRETASALTVDVKLDTVGQYRFLALTSESSIPPPHGRYDADRAAVLEAHRTYNERRITVR